MSLQVEKEIDQHDGARLVAIVWDSRHFVLERCGHSTSERADSPAVFRPLRKRGPSRMQRTIPAHGTCATPRSGASECAMRGTFARLCNSDRFRCRRPCCNYRVAWNENC